MRAAGSASPVVAGLLPSASGLPWSGPTTRWTHHDDGPPLLPSFRRNAPSLAADPLYVGNEAGTVYALDLADGRVRWQFDAGAPSVVPIPAGDAVYVGGDGLRALDPADGRVRWRLSVGHPLDSPVVGRERVYAAGTRTIHAVDEGRERWRRDLDAGILGTPLVAGSSVYVSTPDAVVALDRDRGRRRWRRSSDGPEPVRLGPAAGGGVYAWVDGALLSLDHEGAVQWEYRTGRDAHLPLVTTGAETVYVLGSDLGALDASDGSVRWRARFDGEPLFPPPRVAGGVVYAGTRDAVYAVDATDGRLRWLFERPSAAPPFWGQVADGVVCVPTGSVHLLDATTGRERWQFDPPSGSVYWAERIGKRVLAVADDGTLYALDPAEGLLGRFESASGAAAGFLLGGAAVVVALAARRVRHRE